MTAHAVLGVDAGSGTVREADHLLRDLAERLGLPGTVVGCTHLVRVGAPHVAVSLTVPTGFDPALVPEGLGAALGEHRHGPAEWAEGAALAAAEHRAGRTGRAALYPGAAELTGTITVGELLDRSAIDRVEILMHGEPPRETRIDTRDHVRPEWRDGTLTLLTMPAVGDLIVPYEVAEPTPCCVDHS